MSNEERCPVWQSMMDKAYGLWQEHNDWSYRDLLDHLDDRHRQAVLLGNLNYQVENGGFAQWVDNGYGAHYTEVCDTFSEFIDTSSNGGCFSNHWLIEQVEPEHCYACDGTGEREDEEYNPGWELSREQDDAYYELNDELKTEVERFLSGDPLPRAITKPETKTPEKPKETTNTVRYPNVRVQLTRNDGNAFAILGQVRKALQRARVPNTDVTAFINEATTGDYSHLLATCMRWVDVA